MLADLLYQLTPRDSQSLLLEVRSIDTLLSIPSGAVSGALTMDFTMPQGRIGVVLAAGVNITPEAIFVSTFNSLGIKTLDTLLVPRAHIANKHENNFAPVAVNSYDLSFYVPENAMILPGETLQLFYGFTSATGAICAVRPRLRILLMPRGNIGV